MMCDKTTVVAWQNENIPGLVEQLWSGLAWPSENNAYKVGFGCQFCITTESTQTQNRSNQSPVNSGLAGLAGADYPSS
jgi:hypothetical protein|eukprot:COSAG03_NODE_20_length_21605_cov_27.875523_13_plen_78_part_00